MILKFTIKGTHEGQLKNPIGYYRMTQRSKFADPGAKRYLKWKSHVRYSLIPKSEKYLTGKQVLLIVDDKPPFIAKDKVKIDIMVFFHDDRRSDPDNVFKGIADALFTQDKNVIGSFDFDFDKENPRVEVTIDGNLA